MTTISKPYSLLAALGLCVMTGCTPAGGGYQGDTKQALTTSVTHGTNVNQSFTLGAQSTQAAPLAFDWTCTNSYENCDFTLTVTTNDIQGDVAAWATSNPTLASGTTFTLDVAVLLMLEGDGGASVLNPEFHPEYTGVSTPGSVTCEYGNGWSCTTNTAPQTASASVPAGSQMTMEVIYEPLATFNVADQGDIDVSQLDVAVDITTALTWQ